MSKFTTQELDLASEPAILLIKYRVMEKVWEFLEQFQMEIKADMSPLLRQLPKELNTRDGKISKGENYKRLPFMMLDFPAYFTKKDIIACRTMFYWGNFISTTLHLQGKFANQYGQALIDKFRQSDDIYFCLNSTPWEYDYKSSNYMLLKKLSADDILDHLQHTDFIKLSVQFPIEEMPDRKQDLKNFIVNVLEEIRTN